MAINEDLIERLTQDDVLYTSDLGSLVGFLRSENSEDPRGGLERVNALRLQVLECYWRRKEVRTDEAENDLVFEEEGIPGHSSSLGQKLPLLLIIPLLKSQAKSDPSLIESTTSILLEYLKTSPKLSEEFYDELESLERLLLTWSSPFNAKVATALVALSASRSSLSTILRALQFLAPHKGKVITLKVGHFLESFSPYGSDPKPSLPTHISENWDIKGYTDLTYNYEGQENEFKRRRIAASPGYIYVLSGNEGLVQIGNGRECTFRGHVYARNPELNTGFIAYGNGRLLLHSANERFQIINSSTLKKISQLELDPGLILDNSETLHFLSDGAQFFWIRSQLITEHEREELRITLDIFDIENDGKGIPVVKRVYLRKTESQPQGKSKEPEKNQMTPTGFDIKTLFIAPVVTCGHYVSFWTTSSQKSIFANRQTGSYLSHSFSVHSGEFFAKHDVSEPFIKKKEFKRKSTLGSSAVTYDSYNDKIWVLYSGGIIGFESSNSKSLAYTKKSLQIPLKTEESEDVHIDDVRKVLLRNGALLCSYQGDEASKNTMNLDIQILENTLNECLKEKDIEGSLCTLKILSKAGLNHSAIDDSICDLCNENSNLKEYILDMYRERLTKPEDKFKNIKTLSGDQSFHSELKKKLLTSLSEYQEINAPMILMILDENDMLISLIVDGMTEAMLIFNTSSSNSPFTSPLQEFLVNFISRYAYFTIVGAEGFLADNFVKFSIKVLRLIISECLAPIAELKLFEKKNIESTIKSTILGTFIHTILVVLSHDKFQTLDIIKSECTETIYELWRCISKIASAQWKSTRDVSLIGQEMGYLSSIPELDTWEPYRVLESHHPINTPYKFEESINMQNVPFIYLQFDPRCAMEADDKFIILRWNRVLAEFTQSTWPERPFKIEWPTSVNLKFETKGKEKKWGFRIILSEYDSQLTHMSLKLPQMTRLSLTASALLSSHMKRLYIGPDPNIHEEKSMPLLGLKLLNRCVWDRESQIIISRIKLPSSIVTKMRDLTGIRLPPLRPSVKETLEINALEEGIHASVLKHLSLFEVVEDLSYHQRNQSNEFVALLDILGQTHRRINALIRRLHILADLENQWELEVDCLREGSVSYEDIFFREYHLNETRWKELTLLGFLKGIIVDDERREKAVNDLLTVLEREVLLKEGGPHFAKTRKIVEGIMEKLELLLKISINVMDGSAEVDLMTQSLTSWPEPITRKKKFLERERSLDDSILQIPNLKKSLYINSSPEGKKSTENDVLNEIFAFIGSHPESAVSQDSFLKAIHTRQSRNECRILSIKLMKECLLSATTFEIGTQVASSLCLIIQDGLQSNKIHFGADSVNKVREDFTELTSILTGIASQFHDSSALIIEILCKIPYEKEDEVCLIKNGLVNLLSVLCSEKDHSELAWRGFKSLANRCVAWEQQKHEWETPGSVTKDEFGLARQLSVVLTNHLVRVTSSYDEKRNESLEEIIALLVFMSNCQTGKDMLSQPSCISDLLELLLEPMSPKMILEIVQLCHIGLPRMTQESLERVNIPEWNLGPCKKEESESKMWQILDLILAKLADYLVPGSQVTPSLTMRSCIPSRKVSLTCLTQSNSTIVEAPSSTGGSHLSLFVHKRKNQSAHEVIQKLLGVNSEVKLFPLIGNVSNMEKVVKMDKELTKMNKAEVLTGDVGLIFHKGTKLASHGFVISIAPKLEENHDSQACRDKNLALSRTDPVRPFISSYVAHSIATKIVLLFHSLAESHIWRDTLVKLLKRSLKHLESIVRSTESLYDQDDPMELFELYSNGRRVIACLSIIGAFDWQLKVGDEVLIQDTRDTDKITAINEDLGVATLDIFGDVLLKRLSPTNKLENQGQTLFSRYILGDLIHCLYTLLTPDTEIGIDPLSAALPANGDGWSLKLAVSRVLAEIRTKSCQLLSLYSSNKEFIIYFMKKSYKTIDMLKLVSKDVLPTDDIDLIHRKLKNLKSIYRDCFKPPMIKTPKEASGKKEDIIWNPSSNYPPVNSTIFSYGYTCLAYHGEPVHSIASIPKGTLILANAKGVSYFEVSVLSLGDITSHTDNESSILSIGLVPALNDRHTTEEASWHYPKGSIFMHSNGKICNYSGGNDQEDNLASECENFHQGDVIGIWLENEKSVRFTFNGSPLNYISNLKGVNLLFPAIHIMKKGIQVKANFGKGGPFRFDEQNRRLLNTHRRVSIRIEEAPPEEPPGNTEMYSFLQFDFKSKNDSPGAAGHRRLSNVPSRNALKSKGLCVYDPKESSCFYSSPGGEPVFQSGRFEPRFEDPLDDDSDESLDDEDLETRHHHEDLNSLLVKSWETKIFPIIRRRFRNDSERRDGLDQIKGALALGMTDIARQTVEFLYEESGGIPDDLHLPTVSDIKDDLSKLSIEGIKKGMLLSVGLINVELGYKIGPQSICETSNQPGEVIDIDIENELVQVETYLKLKGVLVRYWYPITALEKSSQPLKSSINPTSSGSFNIHNPDIHREVLNMEFALSRIYCRSAYIKLLLFSTGIQINDLDFENEDESLVSSIMMLQDPDIENLRLLSESFLLKSDIYGNILDPNITIHKTRTLFDIFSGELSKLFYFKEENALQKEITRLLELTNGFQSEILDEIFDCLKNPSKYFITEEIEINDLSILKSILRFENCAFVAMSIKYEESSINTEDLTIQIQTLNGTVLKPNGRSMARDIIQYPVGKKFPPAFIAEEMIQVSHGGGGMENRPSLYLHGIHRDFPLAVACIETLMTQSCLSPSVGVDVTNILVEFLMKYSPPLIIKERILDLILNCIKTFQIQSAFDNHATIKNLFEELKHLYAKESKEPHFSSYFIALNELLLFIKVSKENPPVEDETPWFQKIYSIVHRLNNWSTLHPSAKIAPNDFSRLLIVTGISESLSNEEIRFYILKIVDPLGGIYKGSELFIYKPTTAEGRTAIFQVRFSCKIPQIKTRLEQCESLHDENVQLFISKFESNMDNSYPEYEALNKYLSTCTIEETKESIAERGAEILKMDFPDNIKQIQALMNQGFDLGLKSTHSGFQESFSLNKHLLLVEQVNEYCRDYSMSPFDIHPNELYESRYDLKALQELNKAVQHSKLLSMISFKDSDEKIGNLRDLLFTSIKTEFFRSKLVLLRNQGPPELSLNPVEDIGITKESSEETWFVQAMNQLQDVDSRQFCVNFATGGDPELPLVVKMEGEEVLGNSGSFRHFLSRSTQELLSGSIPLFVPNLGSQRKGLWTLRYDECLSYNNERYLKFFGQLMGMALRAGIPLALSLMPQNWKSLATYNLDEERDLRDFDSSSYNLIVKIQSMKSEEEFEEFLEEAQFPKMSILDVSGVEKELIPDGASTYLSWSNRKDFVESLRAFKMREITCSTQWSMVKAGLATIVPVDIFVNLLKPSEMESIVCGPNKINTNYIKEHTIYQAGIKDSDPHVKYFWSVLETLSESQIQKFIKFCSNQDRIQTWSEENLPPYPMKIAPAPGDDPDQRHIRVETCMFMIKLPKYSTYEIMRDKIIFAISSAMDPLSG